MAEFTLVHRPLPALTGEAPHPALLLLHGRGADERDLLPLGQELDPRLFTIAARAPFRFPWGGFAWYDLAPEGVGFPDPESLQTSLDLLRRFLTEIVGAYPIDPGRLSIGGFSMGAVMAGTLALLEPNRLAAAIILSGYLALHNDLPFHPAEARGLSIFQAHGTLDQVIPVGFARETRAYLESTPVDLTYREYAMGHEIGGAEFVDLQGWVRDVLARGSTAIGARVRASENNDEIQRER